MQIDSNIPEVARRQIEHIAEVCERIKPLVVIQCITYNHEAFLKDALEGFLMQKTDFPFVAVVHDDASTDGTAAVLREYAERYPDIILPIFEEENQYSKRNKSVGRIMNAASKVTGAKYVALCEGDDYWTCPDKLQRQVDFLETNPEYSLVFHNAPIKYLDGTFNYKHFYINGSREYSASEIIRWWTIPTASVVHRVEYILDDPTRFNNKFKFGDNVLFLTAAKYGKLFGIDEYWSVYRQHMGGMILSNSYIKWTEILINQFNAINEVYGDLLDKNLCKELNAKRYIYIIRRNRNNLTNLFHYTTKAIKDCGLIFINLAFKTWILRK